MIIHASEAHRGVNCSGAFIGPRTLQKPNFIEARTGTAIHETGAAVAKAIELSDDDIQKIVDRYGVEADDVGRGYYYAKQAIVEIREWFPNLIPEYQFSKLEIAPGIWLVGRGDLLGLDQPINPGWLSVGDWKSGAGQIRHTPQLLSYALLARAEFGMPSSGYIFAAEIHLQHGQIYQHKFSADRLDQFQKDLAHQALDSQAALGTKGDWADREPEILKVQHAAGAHCTFCPREHECPTKAEYTRGSVTSLVQLPKGEIVSRETIGDLYGRYKDGQRALANFEGIMNQLLDSGPIPLPDGTKLQRMPQKQDKIDAAKAFPVILENLTHSELNSILSVPKGKLLDIAASKMPRGKGAAERRRVLGALREVGAVSKITTYRRKIVGKQTSQK